MKILLFVGYSNLSVALSSAFILLGWSHFLTKQFPWLFSGFVFFATLAIYTFHRIYKSKKITDSSKALQWARAHRRYLLVTLIFSSFASSLLIWKLQLSLLLLSILAILLAFSLFYVIPIFRKSLREISFLKAPLVALVWTTVLIILPSLHFSVESEIQPIWFIAFFIFFLALTIPFDLRDLNRDDPKISTLPQLLGKKLAILVSCFFVCIFYLIIILSATRMRQNIFFNSAILMILILILTIKEDGPEGRLILLDLIMGMTGFSFSLT